MDPEGSLPSAPEVALISSPEGYYSLSPSRRLDSVPEGYNNVDNDNGTALGRPRRNRRSPAQYNTQYNVPTSKGVSDQQDSVAEFVLDSTLYGTFSMGSQGEIRLY